MEKCFNDVLMEELNSFHKCVEALKIKDDDVDEIKTECDNANVNEVNDSYSTSQDNNKNTQSQSNKKKAFNLRDLIEKSPNKKNNLAAVSFKESPIKVMSDTTNADNAKNLEESNQKPILIGDSAVKSIIGNSGLKPNEQTNCYVPMNSCNLLYNINYAINHLNALNQLRRNYEE